VNDWNDIALVGAGGQFWHHSAVLFMYFLTSRYVGKDFAIAEYRCCGIIATALDAQYNGAGGFWWIQRGQGILYLRD